MVENNEVDCGVFSFFSSFLLRIYKVLVLKCQLSRNYMSTEGVLMEYGFLEINSFKIFSSSLRQRFKTDSAWT